MKHCCAAGLCTAILGDAGTRPPNTEVAVAGVNRSNGQMAFEMDDDGLQGWLNYGLRKKELRNLLIQLIYLCALPN